MSKVRINDLARELEVKSRSILDALTAVGVTEKKTHSSSIEADEAEKVRDYFNGGGRGSASKPAAEAKPKFDLSKVSKPGDALKAILERKQAEAAAKAAPPAAAGGGSGVAAECSGCAACGWGEGCSVPATSGATSVPSMRPCGGSPETAARGGLCRCRVRGQTISRLRRQLRRLRAGHRPGR